MTSNPIEAEYRDGFILNEALLNDTSLYDPKRNTMFDIVNKLPEAIHGPMVRFSIYVAEQRIDLNWPELPNNAKPIRYKQFEIDQNVLSGELSGQRLVKIVFGFEYFDASLGKNVQKLREIS